MTTLSVVIPAYNEENGIAEIIERVLEYGAPQGSRVARGLKFRNPRTDSLRPSRSHPLPTDFGRR